MFSCPNSLRPSPGSCEGETHTAALPEPSVLSVGGGMEVKGLLHHSPHGSNMSEVRGARAAGSRGLEAPGASREAWRPGMRGFQVEPWGGAPRK